MEAQLTTSIQPTGYPIIDLALARRLERTEARANASFVEARARVEPEIGATWTEIAGAYAMFDGVGSFITQSFGLGLFDPIGPAELDALEEFFLSRGAEVMHEVSPLADPSLLAQLGERGYLPVELTNVLFRPTADFVLSGSSGSAGEVRVREVGEDEADLWASVAAAGWGSESPEVEEFVQGMGRVNTNSELTYCFLAEKGADPIAAASLAMTEDVAILSGASTIPRARRQGAQRALLEHRLRFAAGRGVPLAMMGAAPGGASHRNAEHAGFRVAYTRIKWKLTRR